MPCLFFDARPRGTFRPAAATSILPFTPIGPPSLFTRRARNTFGPHRIAADCPLLFRRSTSILTPESLFISCLRTRATSYIVAHSSVSASTNGKTVQWKRTIAERSTLIKIAVLSHSLSLSVYLSIYLTIYPLSYFSHTRISTIFLEKRIANRICPFWISLRNICGHGVI